MPRQTSKPTENPWASLDAIMAVEKEPTGPEWFTTEQFAERYGLSRRCGEDRLRKMLKEGKLDHWRGTSQQSRRTINKWRVKA